MPSGYLLPQIDMFKWSRGQKALASLPKEKRLVPEADTRGHCWVLALKVVQLSAELDNVIRFLPNSRTTQERVTL